MPAKQVDYRLILKEVCQAVIAALSTSFNKFSKPMPADGIVIKFGTFSLTSLVGGPSLTHSRPSERASMPVRRKGDAAPGCQSEQHPGS